MKIAVSQEFDDNDIHNLALCAWKEARGEPQPNGCQAVMCVILNRIGVNGFAETLHDVIYARNQFTSMSVPADPEYNLQPAPDDATFLQCMEQAKNLLAAPESVEDITNGASYYANLHVANSGWFFKNIVLDGQHHPITAQLGRHTFFR